MPADRSGFTIRSMKKDDIPRVLHIEKICHSHPWTPEMFREELGNPVSAIDLLWVGENLTGYICFWHIVGEVHILNLAVSPLFRRKGAASRLLVNVLMRPGEEIERAYLEVRKGNEAALALYEVFGFRRTAVRARYYHDGEDAVLMEWKSSLEARDSS